jgi:hypothetical protein
LRRLAMELLITVVPPIADFRSLPLVAWLFSIPLVPMSYIAEKVLMVTTMVPN